MAMNYKRVVYFLRGSAESGAGYYWESSEAANDYIGPFWSVAAAREWAIRNKATIC